MSDKKDRLESLIEDTESQLRHAAACAQDDELYWRTLLEALKELKARRDSGALAHTIADALFTNGAGEKAERLVLELPDKRDGGGWCRKAVENVIIAKLEALNA